jgi:hypothetical protein
MQSIFYGRGGSPRDRGELSAYFLGVCGLFGFGGSCGCWGCLGACGFFFGGFMYISWLRGTDYAANSYGYYKWELMSKSVYASVTI